MDFERFWLGAGVRGGTRLEPTGCADGVFWGGDTLAYPEGKFLVIGNGSAKKIRN